MSTLTALAGEGGGAGGGGGFLLCHICRGTAPYSHRSRQAWGLTQNTYWSATINFFVPEVQSVPVYPAVHTHVNPPTCGKQTLVCGHGFLWQKSIAEIRQNEWIQFFSQLPVTLFSFCLMALYIGPSHLGGNLMWGRIHWCTCMCSLLHFRCTSRCCSRV